MKKFFLSVCANGDISQAPSVLKEFKKAAEPVFAPMGVTFTDLLDETETVAEILVLCPSSAAKEQVRGFIKGRTDVREPRIPLPLPM